MADPNNMQTSPRIGLEKKIIWDWCSSWGLQITERKQIEGGWPFSWEDIYIADIEVKNTPKVLEKMQKSMCEIGNMVLENK